MCVFKEVIGEFLRGVVNSSAGKKELPGRVGGRGCRACGRRGSVFCVLAFCWVVLIFLEGVSPAGTVVTAEQVNALAERVNVVSEGFMEESFEVRCRYEYRGKFLNPADREKLGSFAREAGEKLRELELGQIKLKEAIEDYHGEDWDLRYGVTGLWGKLAKDVYVTGLSRCEIDFYVGISAGESKQSEILGEAAGRIGLLNRSYETAYSHLLKARIFGAAAEREPKYKTSAGKELELLAGRADVQESTALRAAIERMKLFGVGAGGQLKELSERIIRRGCADDVELVLSLAFLHRRLNEAEGLEGIFRVCPEAEDFVGSMLLSELSAALESGKVVDAILNEMRVLDAELAARAAWKGGVQRYSGVLNRLYGEKRFQTPFITYVLGLSVGESETGRAVCLLTEASGKQQRAGVEGRIGAERMAEQAARLSYSFLLKGKEGCGLVLDAFENYREAAKGRMDEEVEYLHAVALSECGEQARAEQLLRKISERVGGKRWARARLDIIRRALREEGPDGGYERTVRDLGELIADCDGQTGDNQQVGTEAVELYCTVLLESVDERAPQKVLDILGGGEMEASGELSFLKSRSLRRLGRLAAAAASMLRALSVKKCEYCEEGAGLLSQILEETEVFSEEKASFIEDCRRVAEVCYGCLEGPKKQKAGLFFAELSVYSARKVEKSLSELEEVVDKISRDGFVEEVDLLRCRARLRGEQCRYDEAARYWAQVGQIRGKEQVGVERRSWKWWRARFYEFYYLSRSGERERKDVIHAIEVLENSFSEIPGFWGEKLGSLKQWCGQQ